MKQIRKKRSIYILLLLFICQTGITQAQNGDNFIASAYNGYYFNPQNIGLSTPQAADFMIYGNLDVNHYNGLLNMGIELDGYKDVDFNLPMSIKYVSSGFMPSKRPSIVGYNWFFNFGGTITRTVKGSPDDTRGNYENKSDKYIKDGLLVAIRNNTFVRYSEQALTGFQMPRSSNSKVPYLWGDFTYDFEPDVFSFSFGHHSGSFIIGNDGNPVSLSGDGYKIDISGLTIQEYSTTTAPQSSTIRITTPDGYLYEFGGNTNYLEYSIPNNPDKVKIKPRHILSWYLKSIKAPNNRMVNFTYQSKLLPNSYTYLLYLKFQMGIVFAVPGMLPSYTDTEIAEQKTMRDDVYSPVITNMTVDNGIEIRFQNTNGPVFYGINDPSVHLSAISQHGSLGKIKETKFTYLTKGRYSFLSRLDKNDQVYQFDYNLPATLPAPLTTSTDHFGFWNGGMETTISDVKSYCFNVENNKNTSGAHYNTGLLTKVTYPTKGTTEIVYEQNTYDRYMERNLQYESLDIRSTSAPILCGGARVKQIKDYDPLVSQTSNLRTFRYVDPQSGRGSGIIGNRPKYEATELTEAHVMGSPAYSSTTYTETISSNSLGYNENLPEYHIGYSDVTEQRSDGSYIHYRYTSNADVPDSMQGTTYSIWMSSVTRDLEIREKNGMYISNDLSHFRGKLAEKKSYNSSGTLVQTEQYHYNINAARNTYNTSVASTPRGPASYRIYLTPCLLNRKETTDSNGVNYTETYRYNTRSIISERKTTNSNGDEMILQYSYPSDYAYSTLTAAEKRLIDNNILSKPVKITTSSRSGYSLPKVLDMLTFEYKIENNFPLVYRIKKGESETDLTTIEEYRKYDIFGRPVCVVKDNINEAIYLWGYKGQYVVAEIKNASYTTVFIHLNSLTIDIDNLSATNYPDMTKLNRLRELMPSAHVATYKYYFGVGIHTMTDPRGIVTNFTYDSYGRLKESYFTENNKKRILEAYEYNYVNK